MFKLVLDKVTVTTTSTSIRVSNLRDLAVQVVCEDRSSGNGQFEIQGSLDGINYKPVMVITNQANSSSEQLTRTLNFTLSANGNDFMFLDNFIGLKFIKVKVTRSTDGKYSAIVHGNKIG